MIFGFKSMVPGLNLEVFLSYTSNTTMYLLGPVYPIITYVLEQHQVGRSSFHFAQKLSNTHMTIIFLITSGGSAKIVSATL